MQKEGLQRHIGTVRKRLIWLSSVRLALSGLLGGAAAACLLAVLGRFVPIPYYRYTAIGLVAGGMALGLLWAAFRKPDDKQTAQEMDRAGGLEERVGTALAHREADTPIARLQRDEAVRYAETFARDARKLLPLPKYPKRLGMLAGLLAGLTALLLWPNPMDGVIEKRQAADKWIAEQTDNTEQMKEELKAKNLPPIELQKLEQELDKLEEGLRDSDTAKEALDELERSMKRLKEQEEQWNKEQKQAEQWVKQMEGSPALKELARSLAEQNRQGMDSALEGLQQQIARMTPEQKRQLAEALDKLAETANSPDEEAEKKLKEALAGAADEAEGESGGLSDEAAQALREALAGALDAQAGQMMAAMQAGQLGGQIAQAGLQAAQQMMAQGGAVSPAWGANGMAAGMASAAAAAGQPGGQASPGSGGQPPGSGGAGAAPGQGGAGSQPGQGAGAGAGAGSGAGSGTGSGAGSGSGSGAGSGAGAGGLAGGTGNGSRGLVNTPRTPAGGGNPESDTGPAGSGGGDILQGGSAPAMDGASRPYEDVYSQYEAEATRSLDRSQLPQTMQQLVRDYFTEIQPNR